MTAPILLSFSGGLDSTEVLRLVARKHPVLCVTMPLAYGPRSLAPEATLHACRRIIRWMRRQPDMQEIQWEVRHQPRVDATRRRPIRPASDYTLDMCATILRERPDITIMMDGLNVDDDYGPPEQWDTFYHADAREPGTIAGGKRWNIARLVSERPDLLRHVEGGYYPLQRMIDLAGRTDWMFETPLVDTTKARIVARMPRALRLLTWTCEFPTRGRNGGFVPCDNCYRCWELRLALSGRTPNRPMKLAATTQEG